MKQETVTRDNWSFFLTKVGLCLYMSEFSEVVLKKIFGEDTHYPTDNVGAPGYIKLDISAITQEESLRENFAESVRGDLFEGVSFRFGSRMEFEGDLCEQVGITSDGYKFSFHIRQYERDSDHDFVIVDPEALPDIPEDEILGRVVWLTIEPAG